MKAEATSTLLPWLIGQKHKPKFKNSSLNPKHVPESKNTSLNPKHIPEFKNTSQNPKKSPRIQKCFGFWEVFWILGCVFGFWDLFWILGRVFEFWEVFCAYEPSYTTFVITWHTYLGSSTADHINLWFGIKRPPGRNERGEVSGIKKTVVPPSSFMALRDRFRSFLGLDVGIFIIYTDCAANLLVERKVYSIDKTCSIVWVQAYIRLTMIILSADCIK